MTDEEMVRLAREINALSPRATTRENEIVTASATDRGLIAVLKDPRGGNVIRREISDVRPASEIVAEMRAEAADRAKGTRARSASWGRVGRS